MSKIDCERPPFTSVIRQVFKSSNGTSAAFKMRAKLFESSAKNQFECIFSSPCAVRSVCTLCEDEKKTLLTYLCSPTSHWAPCSRCWYLLVTWQANRFHMRIETDAGITVRSHFYDGNVIAVRAILSKFGMHDNGFNAKASFVQIQFFQIMVSNHQMQIRLLWHLMANQMVTK